jgi:AraC-like DNA-binding protein
MKQFDPYLEEYHLGGEFYRLFEHIPNIMFFAKDRKRRLFMGNQEFLEHCGFTSVEELVGKADIQIFPKYMEDKFARDDKKVFSTGKPLFNLVELFPSRDRLPEWYITTKYPIFDKSGSVAAICGLIQNYECSFDDANDPVSKVVNLIKARFNQTINIPTLSREAGLSQRQLERLFKKRFSINPREYILRLRVLIAADQLRYTSKAITEIALECGFYDHSSFTRQFKRHMGILPLKFRNSEGR